MRVIRIDHGSLHSADRDRLRVESTEYCWFLISSTRIQAWREADELAGRELMGDGRWPA